MTQPINLGIIGAGLAVKKLHWPALERLRDRFNIVAVADIDRSKAEATARMVGAERIFTDYHDLLALGELDAVLLSLPIHLTAPIALEAARAGKHLVIEKPIGANLVQAQELRAQLDCLPITVLVAENFRYRADIRAARQIVRDGTLGDLILVRFHSISKVDTTNPDEFGSTPWRHDIQFRGGMMLDAGVHHVAALRELAGDVEWVQAFTKYGGSQYGGPTTMSMNLRFRSGALGSYVYSVVCHDDQPTFLHLSLYGTEATLEITQGGLRILRPGQAAETISVDVDDGGYYGEFLNFYEALRENKPVVATVEQSYKDMDLIMRALDSAEQAALILL